MLATAAEAQGEETCSPVLCGNVTIQFPFMIVQEQAAQTKCGWAGFQVVCHDNTPFLGYYRDGYQFQILNISYNTGSLLVADVHKLSDFNPSSPRGCHAPRANSTTKVGPPFSISPRNQYLIFYNCEKAPAPGQKEKLVETICRNNTFVRAAELFDKSGSYGPYFLEGCGATVLPVLGASGKTNASRYEDLIRDGFLLTWQLSSLPPLPPQMSTAAAAAARPANLSSCLPKKCGNLDISYPFWLEEPSGARCGSPSFQLKCNSSGAFLSRSVLQSYRVVSIFVHNNSFHVVDDNLPLATGCPAPFFNISLGIGLAPFLISTTNYQLLFLSKCKEPSPSVPPGFRRMPCNNLSFVNDVVPTLGAPDGSGDDHVARMKNGFLLKWTGLSTDCPGCVASGGECMYGDNGVGFACKCSDGMHHVKCVASGVGGGALLVVCVLFYIWQKHKRRKHGRASSDLMRSGSSFQSYSKDLELGGSPHIFTYEELEAATDGFSGLRELGDGGFGTVYKGKLRDGRVVAVKRLYKNNYKRVEQFINECYKLTDKSDVYSFGVVLVELISSKPAVDMSRSHSEINLANMALNRIQNHEVEQLVDPEIGYETDSETKRMIDLVAELAFQCLQMERDLRPSIKEVVEVLNCIKNGECPTKRNSSPKEDVHLLKNSIQYSPDSVIHRYHSQSTNHSGASNASG
ncbi:hypothetical protein PR202_gb26527 [Eleusine coracana subsp. coracana]|uniref:Protein kinase domain-containing protein n=1 Tax=Eleusine coracana subsp. coracana TaxID=191504 RepID=A0AAV5FRD6_ELECO|nr:hypothetical protein PR202_gb26527 [Eleusine coracana subsp. coracana]